MMARRVMAGRGGFNPKALFANNEQGVWYDPSDFSTMFQDAAGTTPVTAVEQPVGLMLDKRYTDYSVAFNSFKSYLQMNASVFSSLSGVNTSFTVEAFVYYSGCTEDQAHIIGNDESGQTGAVFFVITSGRALCFSNAGSGEYTNTNSVSGTVPLNSWSHIAASKNNDLMQLYVNGTLVASNTITSATIPTYIPCCIGERYNGYRRLIGKISNLRIVNGVSLYNSNFTPPTTPLTAVAGTTLLTCGTSWSGNPAITRNGDVLVSALNPFNTGAGNHAYQSTSANRPTLSARVNLLTKTEQFDDAAWNKANVAVTANQAIAPDGTTTADKLVASAGNSVHYLYQYVAGSNPSLTYAIYAKKAEYNYVYLKTQLGGSTLNYGIVVDLTTGSVTETLNNATGYTVSSSVSDAGNGWRRVVINVAPVTYMYFSVVGISTSTITYSSYSDAIYTGDGTSGIYIWGADLRPANLGSNVPVYQRVNTSTDYDTVGFPLYLAFNGTSSSMATGGIDFSATDKMSVFAGVRKLSDATNARIIAELSATTESNNGSFSLQAPDAAGAATYLWQSKGTALTDAQATGRTAPITNILTGIGDIAGDSAILRVNGVQADSDTGDQGTRNYGNYPLYIGARGGSVLYFNGHLYSLIVRGAQSSANLITATERYVARKTGVTL